MNKLKLVSIIGLLTACGAGDGSTNTTTNVTYICDPTNVSGAMTFSNNSKYRPGILPIKVYLNKSVPFDYKPEIKEAAEFWNKLLRRKVIVVQDEIDQSSQVDTNDGKSVIYFLYTWPDDKKSKSQTAETQIRYYGGGYFMEADIKFNLDDFRFSLEPQPDKIHFLSVMTHEFGHVLGLDDNHRRGSIMYIGLWYNQVWLDVDLEDVQDITCIYRDEPKGELN